MTDDTARIAALSAQNDALRRALEDAKDNGLIYWEPNTTRGHIAKAEMLTRVEAALSLPAPSPSRVADVMCFAQAILHGDEIHRAWLLEAAEAYVAGKPMPPARTISLSEPSRVAALPWKLVTETDPPHDLPVIVLSLNEHPKIYMCRHPMPSRPGYSRYYIPFTEPVALADKEPDNE